MEKSPFIAAVDLLRTYLSDLSLADINSHAVAVRSAIFALEEYLQGHGFISAVSRGRATLLQRELRAHLLELQLLRESLQADMAAMLDGSFDPLPRNFQKFPKL